MSEKAALPKKEDLDLTDAPRKDALPAGGELDLSEAPKEKKEFKYRNHWMPEAVQHQLFDDTDTRAGIIGFADKATMTWADELGGKVAKLTSGDGVKFGKGVTEIAPDDTPEVIKLKRALMKQIEHQPDIDHMVKDSMRDEDEAAYKNHKKSYNVGSGFGIAANAIATAPLTGGVGVAKGGAQLTARQLANQTAKQGMKFGAVGGLGTSKADLSSGKISDYMQAGMDTASGAVSGAAIGYVAPSAVQFVTYLGKSGINAVIAIKDAVKNGVVTPNAASEYLRKAGVDNQTLGHMNPNSWVNEMEQASSHSPIGGDAIKAQRAAAGNKTETAMINETLPEGAVKLDMNSNIGKKAKMRHVDEAHASNYDSIKGHRIDPELHKGEGQWQPLADLSTVDKTSNTKADAFGLVTKPSQKIAAKDSTRKAVADFLEGIATMFPKNKTADGKIGAEVLHSARSEIRQAAREYMEGMPGHEERQASRMLKDAGAGITERLERDLPPEVSAKLRASDAKYGDFIKMLKATAKSGDAPHVSPGKVSAEFKNGANIRDFVLGDGTPLQQLASAGRNLDVTVPKTGFMEFVMHTPPGKYAGGALMSKANSDPALRAAFLGKAPWQSKFRAFDDQVGSKLGGLKGKLSDASKLLNEKLSVSPNGLLSRALVQHGSEADSDVVPSWMTLGLEKTLEEEIEEKRKEEKRGKRR